jgi:transcriptional regulator GlxA family with amidase domain
VRRLAEDPGTRIGCLAGSAAGTRRLERKFLDRVGVSPKRLARVFRLQKAVQLLASGEATGWAEVAAASGYADQAHLTREFAELVGASPQQALRERGLSVSFNTARPRRGSIRP